VSFLTSIIGCSTQLTFLGLNLQHRILGGRQLSLVVAIQGTISHKTTMRMAIQLQLCSAQVPWLLVPMPCVNLCLDCMEKVGQGLKMPTCSFTGLCCSISHAFHVPWNGGSIWMGPANSIQLSKSCVEEIKHRRYESS